MKLRTDSLALALYVFLVLLVVAIVTSPRWDQPTASPSEQLAPAAPGRGEISVAPGAVTIPVETQSGLGIVILPEEDKPEEKR
jgi:hypothetical protein